MKVLKNALLLSCLIFTVIGCDESCSGNEEPVSFDQLDGNAFLFVVEQKIEGSVTDGFSIDDSLYVAVENGNLYTVSFSVDHSKISINPGDLSGSLETETDEILKYVIDDGFFAGGRFVVWIENRRFHAELTEYGSGVPVVASEKGTLNASE